MTLHQTENQMETQVYFLWDSVMYTFLVEGGFIHLKYMKAPSPESIVMCSFDKYIEMKQVISTTYEKDAWRVDENGEPVTQRTSLFNLRQSKLCSCFVFIIHYWVKSLNHCRRFKTIKLFTSQENDCINLHSFINQELSEYMKQHAIVRPQNLLMFINPYSGKKEAKVIYDKIVSPLLEKANVKRTVIVTTHKDHAKEYIVSNDISEYDGIVSVSGDGTLSEIVNSVLVAEQQKQNILLDGEGNVLNKPIIYAKAPIKFGIIPAGSTNSLNLSSQGTTDPETATLQIICGESHPLDVSSIHDDQGNFLRFMTLFTTYGHSCDFYKIRKSLETFGTLGTVSAYIISLIKLKFYAYVVRYLPSSNDPTLDLRTDATRCRYPCNVCLDGVVKSEVFDEKHSPNASQPQIFICNNKASIDDNTSGSFSGTQDSSWKTTRGRLTCVSLINSTCKCATSPDGPSPSAHLSDGFIDCAIVNETTLLSYAKFVHSLHSLNISDRAQPIVQIHRVKGIHLQMESEKTLKNKKLSSTFNTSKTENQTLLSEKSQDLELRPKLSRWYVDGDNSFNNANITVWVHRGLIRIFSKGLEKDPAETPV